MFSAGVACAVGDIYDHVCTQGESNVPWCSGDEPDATCLPEERMRLPLKEGGDHMFRGKQAHPAE